MRVSRKTCGGIVLGLVVGWLCLGSGSSVIAQALTGIWDSHVVQETYRVSIGVDAVGKPRKEERVDEIRTHFNLPQHYGNLIGITGHGDSAVLWYQDNQGMIRNAIVPAAASKLARIQYSPTQRYEEDILP